MVLPELLGGVLAGHALEDLGAARVLVDKLCGVESASGHGMGSCVLGEEGGKKGKGGKGGVPVTLYTFASTMMYRPFAPLYCATSAGVNC